MGAHFVIAGDLNADPVDGDSTNRAILQLLQHPRVQAEPIPTSRGGREKSVIDGEANAQHRGDASCDTGDFADARSGNLRIDYVLPSRSLKIVESGVFWPSSDDPAHPLVAASDHRLVWVRCGLPVETKGLGGE